MIDLSFEKGNELVDIGKVTNSIPARLWPFPAAAGGAVATNPDDEKKREVADLAAHLEFSLLRQASGGQRNVE